MYKVRLLYPAVNVKKQSAFLPWSPEYAVTRENG